jgi:hypothetical protein
MNIYALASHKVRFTGEGGYDWDKERAKEKLNVGEIYTIHHTEVSSSNTDVYLVGIERKTRAGDTELESFNSVMFEDVELQDPLSDKEHPDYYIYNLN